MAILLSLLTSARVSVPSVRHVATIFVDRHQTLDGTPTLSDAGDDDLPRSSDRLKPRKSWGRRKDLQERARYHQAPWPAQLNRMFAATKRGLLFVPLTACAFARAAQAAEPSPAEALTSKSTGSIEIAVQQHSPIYAEVDRSSTLSQRLVDALAAKGFTITQNKAEAKAVLTFRGDIALLGGPTFSKGVKVAIGDAVEKSLLDAKDRGNLNQSDVVQTVAAVVVNTEGLTRAITPFWQGLYLSNMASALGDAAGIKAGFNKALTGDPRGICLSRCGDWNKVNQTVYLSISLQDAVARQEIRVMTRLSSETVVPQAVLDHALADGIEAIKMVDASAGGLK